MTMIRPLTLFSGKKPIILLCLLFISVVILEPASATDAGSSFIKERTISGFRDIRDCVISPDEQEICIITHDNVTLIDIESMSKLSERQFDNIYFKSGCWIGSSIYLTSFSKHPETFTAPDVTILSDSDLSTSGEYSIEDHTLDKIKSSPDGRYIAGFWGKSVYIHDTSDMSFVYSFTDHAYTVEQIAWNPSGSLLASVGWDIWIHDINNGSSYSVTKENVKSTGLLWSPNGTYLYNLFSPGLGALETYNVNERKKVASQVLAYSIEAGSIDFESNTICIAVEQDLRLVSLNTSLGFWDDESASANIRYIHWGWDGYRIVSVADDGVFREYLDQDHVNYNRPPEIVIFNPVDGEKFNCSLIANGSIIDDSPSVFGYYQINNESWQPLQKIDAWNITIEPSSLTNGTNTLNIRATDMEKESTASISFVYEPPPLINIRPEVEIISPMNGSSIYITIFVEGISRDDVRIESVFINVDGNGWTLVQGTDEWHYLTFLSGTETDPIWIEVKATDGELESEIDRIILLPEDTTDPTNSPPELSLNRPRDNEFVFINMNYEGTTTDDDGPIATFMSINGGIWSKISTQSSWSGTLAADQLNVGDNTISFIAYDGELLSDLKRIVVNNVDYSSPLVEIISPKEDDSFEETIDINGTVLNGHGDIITIEMSTNMIEWTTIGNNRSLDYILIPEDASFGRFILYFRASDTISMSEITTLSLLYYRPPSLSISSPDEQSSFRKSIIIKGEVIDGYNEGLEIEIRIEDGLWTTIGNTRDWEYELNNYDVPSGEFEVNFRAFDGYQYSDNVELNLVQYDQEPQENEKWIYYLAISIIIILIMIVLYKKDILRWK